MRTGTRRFASTGLLIMGVTTLVAVGCDKVPLTAPASSTITLSAPTRTLPTGGSTQLSAIVMEPAGTPVQDGTSVRFQTNLGRLEPADAHTRGGVATTTFFAGDVSGAAEVKALSGPAGSATTGANATATNAVTILIGNAAVGSLLGKRDAPALLARTIALVGQVPVYRLSLARDSARITEIVDTIFSWHDRTPAPVPASLEQGAIVRNQLDYTA